MSLAHRLLQGSLWAMSDHIVTHGYPIGYVLDEDNWRLAATRVGEALAGLHATWPRWLQRMRAYVSRIQIREIVEATAMWQRATSQVDIDLGYVTRPDTTTVAIASTLVHEFTHARIAAVGVAYDETKRVRIERACVGQELCFLRALRPTSIVEQLIVQRKKLGATAEDAWSEAAHERGSRKAAKEFGIPSWFVDLLWWFRRWRRRRRHAA